VTLVSDAAPFNRRSYCGPGRAQVVLRDALKEHTDIDEASLKQLSMLRILHASCITALDAFRAADNPVDAQLVIDLETMVERTRVELERFANPS
jgi:hypothetical protein